MSRLSVRVPSSVRARLRVEQLEDRVTPAYVWWDGGGDGVSVLDPLNYDSAALPLAA